MSDEWHIFISHVHEDNEHVDALKKLLAARGMDVRNGSVTTDKFNDAKSEAYIKQDILKPRIDWSSVLVVLVSAETKDSTWVNWEIQYAEEAGKRIVVVYEHGESGVDLPAAAEDYADAIVGWNTDTIIDAIEGKDHWESSDGTDRPIQPLKRQDKC